MENIKQYEQRAMATRLLNDENVRFIDTQTTGMDIDDEVVEMTIKDGRGNVIYSSLFSPEVKMKKDAILATKLTDDDLRGKPLFRNEYSEIIDNLNNKIIAGWNIKFDMRMLRQTANKNGIPFDLNDNCLMIDLRDITESFYDVEGAGLRQNEVHNAFHIPNKKTWGTSASIDDMILILRAMDNLNSEYDDILLHVSDRKRSDILNSRGDVESYNSQQYQNEYIPSYTKYANAWRQDRNVDKIAEEFEVKKNTVILNLYKAMDVGYINYYSFSKNTNSKAIKKVFDEINLGARDFGSFLQKINNTFKEVSKLCKKNDISIIDLYDYGFRKFHNGVKQGSSIMNNDLFNQMNFVVQEDIKEKQRYKKKK